MSLSNTAKSVAKRALIETAHLTRFSHALSRKFGGRGCVMMYHEITAGAHDRLGQGCSVERFEKSIASIHKRGFDFVSLDEAHARLGDKNAKPFVAITFDDGYKDNLSLALPILEKYNAPATIFVPTQVINRQINAWWLAIRDMVTRHEMIEIELLGAKFECSSLAQKQSVFQQIVDWIWDDFNRVNDLELTFARYDVDMAGLVDALCITQDEMVQADKHPLIQIGAHTVTHRPLSILSDRDALSEMVDNKTWLEGKLDREIKHFAYPYGRPAISGDSEAALAQKAGFELAVTTDPACLFDEHAKESLLWPRANGEFSTSVEAGVSWAVNGTWPAFKSRFSNAKINLDY